MIVVIDYGMGNIGSIVKMLSKAGHQAISSGDLETIGSASKLILPGVGSFDNGMTNLKKQGLDKLLTQKVMEDKIPILGVCLGIQLMTKQSEEGNELGLGWLDAETKRFQIDDKSMKIPHMGWNKVEWKKDNSLTKQFDPVSEFYFVHSYHVELNVPEDALGITNYGYDFVSAVQRENIVATQFHPEKSHRFGLQLMKNFAEF